MKKNTSIRRIMAIVLSLLLVLGIVAPIAFVLSASATPEELPLTYLGDRNLCKMPKEMALAYANAIDNAQSQGYNQCALVDVAQDGMPILLLCRATFSQESGYYYMTPLQDDLQIWVWNGTEAQRFTHPNLYDCDYHFGWHKDIPVLKTNTWQYGMATGGASYFRIKNGNLQLLKTYAIEVGPLYFIDGKQVSEADHSDDLYYYFTSYYTPFTFGEQSTDITTPFSDCAAYSAYLKTYAGAFSGYTGYEEVSGRMHTIAEDAMDAAIKDGESCIAIYELVQNQIFYGIMESGDEEIGVLVRNVGKDGEYNWLVYDRDMPPMTQEQLNQAVYDLKYATNIHLDYQKINSLKTVDKLTDYLEDAIENAIGTPNDAAINELILFAENAISNLCTKKIYSFGNKFTLGFRLARTLKKAKLAKEAVEDLFYDYGLPMNNPIDVVVPVLWKNCKPQKKCRIIIADSTCEMLSDVELRVYLGNNQHYLQFNYDNTDYDDNAEYTFLKGDNNTYEIDCVNEYGDSIFHSYLGVGLPAISETSTVMETYNGETRNIGCQYDAASSVVFFETQTGGQYQVVDNYVQIDDITHLSDESQNAIRFLVANNYMSINGTEFYPDDFLNRYQFAQALVGMFFAWRNDLTDAFPDVPADHPYFHYIASGKQENIIEGYDDGLYYGDNVMTMEQMLSLAARTLVNKKGYTYPGDYTSILDNATIDGSVSLWAQESVAMALRDGLWEYDETIHPQSPITKEQAALVLYRLFLLLQEVSPIAVNGVTNVLMVTVAVIASVAIVICIALIVILLRKNNQINRRKKGNANQ